MTRFWRPVRVSSSVASWAATPMFRRTAAASRTTSNPATRALPAVGHRERRDDPQRRRLAGAVGAEQAEDRPPGDLEVDAGEGDGRTEVLRQAFDFDHQLVVHRRPPSWDLLTAW